MILGCARFTSATTCVSGATFQIYTPRPNDLRDVRNDRADHFARRSFYVEFQKNGTASERSHIRQQVSQAKCRVTEFRIERGQNDIRHDPHVDAGMGVG